MYLRDPLLPQSTITGQRPSFVFDPTFHRQVIRPPIFARSPADLLDLTQRGLKGTWAQIPRWYELLEKAAARDAGTIEAHYRHQLERGARELEQEEARKEAERQAEFERERRLAALGVDERRR